MTLPVVSVVTLLTLAPHWRSPVTAQREDLVRHRATRGERVARRTGAARASSALRAVNGSPVSPRLHGHGDFTVMPMSEQWIQVFCRVVLS
ncbi:hypothetical protein [Kineococcus aurantiacus]|uniref:Uncharacterized protein n=1 Tax=Kineococcus aurantiacus TaxID=37633 RepID=A0A7Y9DNC2_9ACTN|nr:hypothetical protein [Kineococcus aurantiacus]